MTSTRWARSPSNLEIVSRREIISEHSRSGIRAPAPGVQQELFPLGNNPVENPNPTRYIPARENHMTAKELGQIVRNRRKSLQMKQADLALVSGTGVRFISDLENGKETCVLGKTFKVLENLGIDPVLRPRDQR